MLIGVLMCNAQQVPEIYYDFGSTQRTYINNNSFIQIRAYTLRQRLIDIPYRTEQDQNYLNMGYQYKFILVLESQSMINNSKAGTWLYNSYVSVNGINQTAGSFPNGIMIFVSIYPTYVFTWYDFSYAADMHISWGSSVYDPRIQ